MFEVKQNISFQNLLCKLVGKIMFGELITHSQFHYCAGVLKMFTNFKIETFIILGTQETSRRIGTHQTGGAT